MWRSTTVNAPGHDVTALLQAWTAGDIAARDQLMAVVYRELRSRAAGQLRRERPGHTLQPTALVHEAYIRLVDQRRVAWQNRGQFFGVACQMMRRILVDRARAHRMGKRSGQWARVTLDEGARATRPVDVDVLDWTPRSRGWPRSTRAGVSWPSFASSAVCPSGRQAKRSASRWRPPSATGRRRGRGC